MSKITYKENRDGFPMRGKKPREKISVETLYKLSVIFKEKGWEIEDDSNSVSLFNRYCTLLHYFTEEEQSLILELTERYTKITIGDYYIHLQKVLNDLVASQVPLFNEINNVFMAPLIAPSDVGKTKSSTTVWYLIRSIIPTINNLGLKKIQYIDNLEVDCKLVNKPDALLIVVDDFIGTGDTASETINYLINEKGIDKSRIVIVTIASLQVGIDKIQKEMEVSIFPNVILNKGITDYYHNDDLEEKLRIMSSIEDKIKVHKNEKLGYKGSEALITLIRTPNNTFPVFWKEKKSRLAPFPR